MSRQINQTPTPKPLTYRQQQREYRQQAEAFFEQLHFTYQGPGMRDALVAAIFEAAMNPTSVVSTNRIDSLYGLYTLTKHMDEIIEMRPK